MNQRTTNSRERRRHKQKARLQWLVLVLLAGFAILAAFIFVDGTGGTGNLGF